MNFLWPIYSPDNLVQKPWASDLRECFHQPTVSWDPCRNRLLPCATARHPVSTKTKCLILWDREIDLARYFGAKLCNPVRWLMRTCLKPRDCLQYHFHGHGEIWLGFHYPPIDLRQELNKLMNVSLQAIVQTNFLVLHWVYFPTAVTNAQWS